MSRPPFTTSGEEAKTGLEYEFTNSNHFVSSIVDGLGGRMQAISHTYNPRWGYIIRAIYTVPDENVEKGDETAIGCMTCWTREGASTFKFSNEQRGEAADICQRKADPC